VLGAICESLLYRALTTQHGDIEIWRVHEQAQTRWHYYSLRSWAPGWAREVALLRYSYETDLLQEEIQGPFGQNQWVAVDRCPSAR